MDVTIIGLNNLDHIEEMKESINPYVVIKCAKRTYQTKAIHDTLQPQWNEFVTLHFYTKPKNLSIHVLNLSDSNSKHKSICDYAVDLRKYFNLDHPGIVYLDT